MFTKYKFSPVQVSDAAVEAAKALAANNPGAAPFPFAAGTIADRLRAKPESYLQFGPYWWAVKVALRAAGHDFGSACDETLLSEYGGSLAPYAKLVAGEQFRAFYGGTFFAGTSQFWLDNEAEESYVLFDQDMEVRRLGGTSPLRVALDLSAVEIPPAASAESAPVLDAVASELPLAVEFAHGTQLWRADLFAADRAEAEAVLSGLLDDAGMLDALDRSKDGAPRVGSAGGLQLYIDWTARRVCQLAAAASTSRA